MSSALSGKFTEAFVGDMRNKPEQLHAHADHCLALAGRTTDPKVREMLMEAVVDFRKAAVAAEIGTQPGR